MFPEEFFQHDKNEEPPVMLEEPNILYSATRDRLTVPTRSFQLLGKFSTFQGPDYIIGREDRLRVGKCKGAPAAITTRWHVCSTGQIDSENFRSYIDEFGCTLKDAYLHHKTIQVVAVPQIGGVVTKRFNTYDFFNAEFVSALPIFLGNTSYSILGMLSHCLGLRIVLEQDIARLSKDVEMTPGIMIPRLVYSGTAYSLPN